MSWVDIANFADAEIDSADYPGGLARVLCELWTGDAGPTVQARLWNVTDGASCGASAVVTSVTPTTADFDVVLTSGVKRYRLQVTSDTTDTDLFVAGEGLMP